MLGRLLTNLQNVVDIFKHTKYGAHPKTDFKLYFTNVNRGSVAAVFQPLEFTTELFKESMVSDDMVFDLQDLITPLIENTDEFREKIERDFEDPSQIIRFLKSFRGMLSRKKKFSVTVGYDTKISQHGNLKNISDDVLAVMYKQLHFESKNEMMRFIDCTKSYEEYLAHLKARNII